MLIIKDLFSFINAIELRREFQVHHHGSQRNRCRNGMPHARMRLSKSKDFLNGCRNGMPRAGMRLSKFLHRYHSLMVIIGATEKVKPKYPNKSKIIQSHYV